MEMYDYTGKPVQHDRARVNGITMHYVTAGEGEPILLLHGTPKSSIYWHKLIPLISRRFKVIAPDLRGFGYTDKPPASEGYDSLTVVKDVMELMDQLGIEKFHIHSEDRGAEYAFVLCSLHPDRVKTLSYGEMAVSGFGIEEASYFTQENVEAHYNKNGNWLWHVPFFFVPHVPEMMIAGHEREFWDFLLRGASYNPESVSDELLDALVSVLKSPGGTRGVLETYRAELKNIKIDQELLEKNGKLDLPIMTMGGVEFYGPTVKDYCLRIAKNVEKEVVFEKCGHNLALEKPEEVAELLFDFMLDRER